MNRHWIYPCSVVLCWLGVVALLLVLVGRAVPAGAQDLRTLQVWPDRSAGFSSDVLEDPAAQAAGRVLPFGVTRATAGDVVQARTYLHFPLDVLPPGTEVKRATLHVYVDSSSGVGEATVGAYRVLEPWEEGGRGDDPQAWPTLLPSPIAVAVIRFGEVTPPAPTSTPVHPVPPTAVPSMSPTEVPATALPPSLTPTVTPGPSTSPSPTPSRTPLPTPPGSPLATPPTSPRPTPPSSSLPMGPASPRLMSLAAYRPALASSAALTVPAVSLGEVAGTWITWDVTALIRAWVAGEVSDAGLALAPAPEPDAGPEVAGDLLVARQLTVDDPDTRPYLIVGFEVRPVAPTPMPVLPSAGSSVGGGAHGLLLIGAVLLILGLGLANMNRCSGSSRKD
jgi:hypothetical protein